MKNHIAGALLGGLVAASFGLYGWAEEPVRRLPTKVFQDKMKGAWLGQMIGVGWGQPTEFQVLGAIIPDDKMPPWNPRMVNQHDNDDCYVEMTFLKTLETYGFDVSIRQAGIDFANSGYPLWHANDAGRTNLRKGIAPPDSGHPQFNKCADDIDYQIEADFSGIISPGMPRQVVALGETFGRLMNYGDGLYAGQFIGGMYAEAYFESNIVKIIEAGLACIPADSQYAEMVRDMLKWHKENPADWETTWQRVEDKYHKDPKYTHGLCSNPGGRNALSIDAKLNGAYILMGLLYGKGDPDQTMRIACRCGQDSDCNPANAGGVCFAMLGAAKIPGRFVEKLDLKVRYSHSDYTLPKVYEVSEALVRKAVVRCGGKIEKDAAGEEVFLIPVQAPRPGKSETSHAPQPVSNSVFTDEEKAKITVGREGVVAADAPAASAKPALKNPAIDWESLPIIRTGVQVWSHTSKSPLNFTVMDWTNYTLQDDDGFEQALFKGKTGQLIHAWYDPSFAVGNLRLWLKDAKTPDYDLPFKDYFNSKEYPHWLWWNQGNMLWAFPCLPFDSVFKAAVTRRPQWYQYTLHVYREGRFSELLSRDELETLRDKIQRPAGAFPGADQGNQTESGAKDIGEQETVVLFDSKTAGVVRSLRLEPPSVESAILDRLFLRMTTDGSVTAEVPVSMFFGGYRGVDMRNAKGMPAGYDGKKLYCYFPMPFWKSMKIELVNKQPAQLRIAYDIGYSDQNPYPQDSTGLFKVQFNDTTPVKAGDPDFRNLSVEGSGTLVGCVSKLTGDIEANFSIFTDGSKTPRIETTGGEDYFNHSYGIHPGFSTAFSGGLADRTAYRFHIIDYVPFLDSIQLTQDHALHFTHDRAGDFLSAVFYYHNPKKVLVQTDSLDVGKQDSESAHKYQLTGSEGKTRVQTDTAAYEGAFDQPITDDGQWTDKESSFVVAIQPNNDGVRIRKRINQTAYHQEIDVYVDGVKAGVWFEQGANYVLNYNHRKYREILQKAYAAKGEKIPSWQEGTIPAKFRDTDFEIPAALTRGKKELRIRMATKGSLAVVPADAGLTNEYYYWIYTYSKDH